MNSFCVLGLSVYGDCESKGPLAVMGMYLYIG
jgi:hypothetical protein